MKILHANPLIIPSVISDSCGDFHLTTSRTCDCKKKEMFYKLQLTKNCKDVHECYEAESHRTKDQTWVLSCGLFLAQSKGHSLELQEKERSAFWDRENDCFIYFTEEIVLHWFRKIDKIHTWNCPKKHIKKDRLLQKLTDSVDAEVW